MAAVFDIAEIKHRTAATGSRLSSAAQNERERNAQLLEILEAVEKTLVHKQQPVQRLERHQDLTLKELQRLSDVLRNTQIGPPRLLWRLLYPKSFKDRADLIDRLDAVISIMNQDGKKGVEEKSANERGTALGRKRSGKALALFTLTSLLVALAFAISIMIFLY